MNQNRNFTLPKPPKPEANPWLNTAELPTLSAPLTVLYSLIAFCCALYTFAVTCGQFADSQTMSAAVHSPLFAGCTLALLFVLTLTICLSTRALVPILVSFAVFVGGLLAGGLLLGADNTLMGGVFALSILCFIAIGAFVITMVRSPLLGIVPIASFAVALLLSQNLLLSVLSLLLYPAAGMLAYTLMGNRTRVGSICAVSGIFLLCSLFGFALLLYYRKGALSGELLLSTLTGVRDAWIADIKATITALVEEEPALFSSLFSSGLTPETLLSATETLIISLFNLLPAFFILTGTLFAYGAQMLCVQTYGGLGQRALVTRNNLLFCLSVPSAVLYLLTCLFSLFISADTLFGAVINNLQLILLPGMCLVGFYKLIGDVTHKRTKTALILFIVGLVIIPSIALLCLSISGAVVTLLHHAMLRAAVMMSQNPSFRGFAQQNGFRDDEGNDGENGTDNTDNTANRSDNSKSKSDNNSDDRHNDDSSH